MGNDQYVCLVCGYNMVGFFPSRCPFCGAENNNFVTSDECSDTYQVVATPVSDSVVQLNSYPPLGLEHAAYRIEGDGVDFMVDCPSTFDPDLAGVDIITFTHHHFLGASNLYRKKFRARVQIHRKDTENTLCRGFDFDSLFEGSFAESGLYALHTGGHTRGFTAYLYRDHLFICDYVFVKKSSMKLNPYGPQGRTRRCALDLLDAINGRELSYVCGYNYVSDYSVWRDDLEKLLG